MQIENRSMLARLPTSCFYCWTRARFFLPRRLDWKTVPLKTPGYPLSNWRHPAIGWQARLIRLLTPWRKQNPSTPPGMSKLPYELKDQIFRELCGREISSTRLVCKDWEHASRPFFAQLYLQKSLLWMTESQLRFIRQLALKFGPYMKHIYIASDRFTVPGLLSAIRNYRHYCTSQTPGPAHTAYLSLNTKKSSNSDICQHWKHCNHARTFHFFAVWLRSSFSQNWLRFTGRDRRLLAELAASLSTGTELDIVNLCYDGQELNHNVTAYGRAAPRFPFEIALFNSRTLATCDAETLTTDVEYEMHLRQVLLNVLA